MRFGLVKIDILHRKHKQPPHLYSTLAHRRPTFTADMTTYYCPNMEEALRRAKKAGREPGCYFGGITLRSGRRGFAVYRDGKVVAQYTAMGRQ
jgi:hypothetical protein